MFSFLRKYSHLYFDILYILITNQIGICVLILTNGVLMENSNFEQYSKIIIKVLGILSVVIAGAFLGAFVGMIKASTLISQGGDTFKTSIKEAIEEAKDKL